MTLYQFNVLSKKQQAELTFYEGKFVDDRIEDDFKVLLYQLYSFYVEMYYNQKENRIVRLRNFSSTTQLDPYLYKINLEGLYSSL